MSAHLPGCVYGGLACLPARPPGCLSVYRTGKPFRFLTASYVADAAIHNGDKFVVMDRSNAQDILLVLLVVVVAIIVVVVGVAVAATATAAAAGRRDSSDGMASLRFASLSLARCLVLRIASGQSSQTFMA